jgi:hypothetical protein
MLQIHVVNAQNNYQTSQQLQTTLQSLVSKHRANATLKSLTKTLGGKDIWALTLFEGSPENNPAVAIIGGVDGSHLLGVELAAKFAENILENHKDVLKTTTFYIFPNMSPDATEQYFSSTKFHRMGNARKTDDDRDGVINEDGFEDLNKDGMITIMRVEDETGMYKVLKEDPRIMVKANINKGEKGTHRIYTEGIDNDKDGKFNEDGVGGVSINKNMSYAFPYFTPGSGEHPVSEKENRALLDFLYQQWNIYAILTFGPSNNLSSPLKYNATNAKKRVVTSILKNDADLNKFISDKYNKIVGDAKNAPKTGTQQGGVFEWSYFHFGKLALGTPGWWPPKIKGDSTTKPFKNKEAAYLQWAEKESVQNTFVNWTSVQHPDFPNKKVDVGGVAPFGMTNPPYRMVDSIANKHTKFLLEVVNMQPNLAFKNLQQESLGNNLTRITVDLYNDGLIPTHTEMGVRSRWMRKINVWLKLNNGQSIVSGVKRSVINSIGADKKLQLTWLIQGKGKVQIEATAPQAGTDKLNINL